MSDFCITVKQGGKSFAVRASGGATLLDAIRFSGASVSAPCGGNGKCGKCRARVWGKARSFEGAVSLFSGESLQSCRFYPAGDLTLETVEDAGAVILSGRRDIPPCGDGLGLAADIGTTTVAVYLYDLSTGKCLGASGALNAQRGFGCDVISRIGCASEPEGLDALSRAIRGQIAALASGLCGGLSRISRFSLAGNTVMEHIFAGLSPESIGKAPFAPQSLFGNGLPAREFFAEAAEDAGLYLCPAVAGYVGGDITAGLLGSGAFESEKTVLFIDVGTNGEMALGGRDGFVCCATAAGPALEGAEIECGSSAVNGAISAISRDMTVSVIGGGAPESICGSGIIDAVFAMLSGGIIDESGRMEGEKYFLGGDVFISARDIRHFQLAKAAIRAGIETLMSECGKGCGGIDEVLIAGGFGAYMSIDSACGIGLLPPALRGKCRHVGNSAGAGAALALEPEGRGALAEIAGKCRYIELSSSKLFGEKYIDAMMFDEWEEVL